MFCCLIRADSLWVWCDCSIEAVYERLFVMILHAFICEAIHEDVYTYFSWCGYPLNRQVFQLAPKPEHEMYSCENTFLQ